MKVKKAISVSELKEMMDSNGVLLIDSRNPGDFNGELGHIKGSINLSLPEMIERSKWLEDQNVPICIICNSGGKSLREASLLRNSVKVPVYSVSGGIIAWHLRDFEVE
ncbi:MAG: rhodanese-like domain-containing protein [Thermoplasmataceae archaeon]|jgi:hydroxyacylglutathione hydrolase|nr:MAG: rhodanese protein [Thermoplasmatales archaeon E-plasma]